MKTVFALLAEFVYFVLGLIIALFCMVAGWNVLRGAKEIGPGVAITLVVALVISYRFFKAAKAARAIRKWRLKPAATIYERYGYSPDEPPNNPAANETEEAAGGDDGGAAGKHASQSFLSGYLETLHLRFQLWCQGLSETSAKLVVVGSLLFVFAVSLFFLRGDPTYVRLYVYGPKENVFVDGVPVTRLKKHDPAPPFANGFVVIEERPGYEITIRDEGQVIHRKKVGKGAYLINATTDSWVAVESLVYKPSDQIMYEKINPYYPEPAPKLLIEPGGLGVHQMSGNPEYYRSVDFESEPPSTVPDKSSRPIDYYVRFLAGKIEEGAR